MKPNQLTNCLLSKGGSGGGGGGLIVPPEGWLDLSTNGPALSVSPSSAGYHDYSADIALGSKTAGTAVTRNSEGIYISAGTQDSSSILIHKLACSSELGPVFHFVFQRKNAQNSMRLCVADETISDNAVVNYENGHIGFTSDAGSNAYMVYRGGFALLAGVTWVEGAFHRIEFEPSMYGSYSLYRLASNDPSDWDSGTLISTGTFNRNIRLAGSVLTPFIPNRTKNIDAVVSAIKVVPRRLQ